MTKLPGLVVIISSPSGTGKTTICKALVKKRKDFVFSVSATTRASRKGEKNGVDYYFISEEKFENMVKKNLFAEWAWVFHHRYGTPLSEIKKAQNKVLLCDIDVQGGMALKAKYPQSVSIFIIPPSFEELKKRLSKRKSESAEELALRLKTATNELSKWKHYDYIVVNDELKKTVDKVDMIITVERTKSLRRNDRRFWTRTKAKLLGFCM